MRFMEGLNLLIRSVRSSVSPVINKILVLRRCNINTADRVPCGRLRCLCSCELLLNCLQVFLGLLGIFFSLLCRICRCLCFSLFLCLSLALFACSVCFRILRLLFFFLLLFFLLFFLFFRIGIFLGRALLVLFLGDLCQEFGLHVSVLSIVHDMCPVINILDLLEHLTLLGLAENVSVS